MAVQERDWFCYMVKCCDGSLYVGVATDVKDRVREHNQGRGAIFTAKRRPVELLWSEGHPNQLSARQRERELKGWRREKKLALASGASTARKKAELETDPSGQ
jgi:predicted GIY-YIG superfamily endonuclease